MLKRAFDLVFSSLGIILLFPIFLFLGLWIRLDSSGPVFYWQSRVGINGKDFFLLKFRTMERNAERAGLLTVGNKDSRITRAGYYLRKLKLDELPQLINVFKGEMSLVGPRPEVRKYVALYTPEQLKVLRVRPGITDYASIEYVQENDLLASASDPERMYIEKIMPAKLSLNAKYIQDQSLLTDLKIIFRTFYKIIS